MIPVLVHFLGRVLPVVRAVDLVATLRVELFRVQAKVTVLSEMLLTVVCLRVALILSQVILGLPCHHHATHLAKVHLLFTKLVLINHCLTVEHLWSLWILIRLLHVSCRAHVQLIVEPSRSAILILTHVTRGQVLALLVQAKAGHLVLDWRVRSPNIRVNLRIRLRQQMRVADRCQGLAGHHVLVHLQRILRHGLEGGRISCCGIPEPGDLVRILVQMNEILISLQLVYALLKLYLVRVFRNLFVFGHQIVLELALDKELQCLNKILIQLFLLLLFPGHLGRLLRLGLLLLLLLLVLQFLCTVIWRGRRLIFVVAFLFVAAFFTLFGRFSLGKGRYQ